MHIFDISIPLSKNTVVWPGDTPIRMCRSAEVTRGDSYNLSSITMSAHIGTHIDAPLHFIDGGRSVESVDIGILCGNTLVIEIPKKRLITASDMEEAGILNGTMRLIIKTDNSLNENLDSEVFHSDYTALSTSAAEWIASRGIRLIGIDYLSIAPFESPQETHRILLSKEVIILEGLLLCNIEPGEYELYCLPLPIVGCDGSPARTILVRR